MIKLHKSADRIYRCASLQRPSICRGNKSVLDLDNSSTLPVKKQVDNGQVLLVITNTVLGRQQVALCKLLCQNRTQCLTGELRQRLNKLYTFLMN
jgi:hypothetical protein